jgi:hypothetical protein
LNADAPKPPSGNRNLVLGYAAACAALLIALVGLAIYGFVIKEDPGVQLASPEPTTVETESSDAPTTTANNGWGPAATEPAAPIPAAEGGGIIDGTLAFTIHGAEVGTTVESSDAPIEKNAVGEYVVVHMTVTNVGVDPGTFVGMFQTLNAGGTTYNIDDEATAYLGGTFADLAPGASADVSIAFDVPPGTPAESITLHADPSTPGAQAPLA